MILSILIATIEKRKALFDRINNLLTGQIMGGGYENKVQIISLSDKGQMSIGEKRNALIYKTLTPYSVFVDDDDLVAQNYVSTIVPILETEKPDAIGFKGILRNLQTKKEETFIHRCGEKYETRNGIHYRPPNHLNPMKTDFYRQIQFPDISHGEDADVCMKIQQAGLIKKCAFIDEVMYYYLYNPQK